MASVSLFNPLCTKCRAPMGEMTQDEFEALILREGSMGLCFDCEPVEPDIVPELFKALLDGDLVDIGDLGFQMRDRSLRVIGSSRSHAHEGVRARGLSSVTYLNTAKHNAVLSVDGVERVVCRKCRGAGEVQGVAKKIDCNRCDGSGLEERAFFLPSWILGLGCENA